MNRDEIEYLKKSFMTKTIHLVINAFVFLAIYLLSKTTFQFIYLFEWTARRYYFFIWIIVIIFIIRGYFKSAYIVTLTNVFALFFGHFFGQYIRNIRMKQIVPGIDPEIAYQLSRNDGWWIWIVLVLLSIIIGYYIGRKNDYID